MPSDPPFAHLAGITGDENLLVLAPHPGDETLLCGGLIAACCRRGRPPFVMVLADGSSSPAAGEKPEHLAAAHDRETRAAARSLGLPPERLLMVGLFDATVPQSGPAFDAVVRAVTLVMWARDCNLLCAPWPAQRSADHAAAWQIAVQVAAGSGVGLLACAPDQGALRLDITPQLAAKRAAVAHHAALPPPVLLDPWEVFAPSAPPQRF